MEGSGISIRRDQSILWDVPWIGTEIRRRLREPPRIPTRRQGAKSQSQSQHCGTKSAKPPLEQPDRNLGELPTKNNVIVSAGSLRHKFRFLRRFIVDASVSGVQPASASSRRLLCWIESLILGLGMPSGIWAISRLISLYIPAAVHGSREQRFLLWIFGGGIVEWSFVIVLWFSLRARRSSFRDLGVWRLGTWPAWTLALLIAALRGTGEGKTVWR